MKKLLFILIVFTSLYSNSQITEVIEVGFTKSAYLIFDGKNVKYDCGSEDVIVRNSDNIIILQAAVEHFEETNLFIEASGEFMMFIIKYKETPSQYMYDFQRTKTVVENNSNNTMTSDIALGDESKSVIKKKNYNDGSDSIRKFMKSSDLLLIESNKIFNRGIKKYKIGLYLRDIVIDDGVYYIKFEYDNSSNIGYKLDFLQYKVSNVKRRLKGESQQNIYLNPLYEYKIPENFEGKNKGYFVLVFDKFVLTKNKKLTIEFWEDNGEDMNLEGGRKIDFDVFSKDILNVRVLNK